MKSIDIYNSFKDSNFDSIVIVKEGIFYKTFNVDAKIMWYLFDYLLKDNIISFGNNSYDKVIYKLKKSNISFVIVNKNEKLLEINNNINNYKTYENLSNISFGKKEEEEKLIKKIKMILERKDCFLEINNFLDKLN